MPADLNSTMPNLTDSKEADNTSDIRDPGSTGLQSQFFRIDSEMAANLSDNFFDFHGPWKFRFKLPPHP